MDGRSRFDCVYSMCLQSQSLSAYLQPNIDFRTAVTKYCTNTENAGKSLTLSSGSFRSNKQHVPDHVFGLTPLLEIRIHLGRIQLRIRIRIQNLSGRIRIQLNPDFRGVGQPLPAKLKWIVFVAQRVNSRRQMHRGQMQLQPLWPTPNVAPKKMKFQT